MATERSLLWASIRDLFSLREDPRPDPEDAEAYRHAELVKSYQAGKAYPEQIRDQDEIPQELANIDGRYHCWVDVYTSKRGDGYIIHYRVIRDGKFYVKMINVGPEEHFEQDWVEEVRGVEPR